MNQHSAIRIINQGLREEHTGYEFNELNDRFTDAYHESKSFGDEWTTIKIPSGSEFTVPTSLVETALGLGGTA